jgi:hypothetical protein
MSIWVFTSVKGVKYNTNPGGRRTLPNSSKAGLCPRSDGPGGAFR